MSTRRTRNNPSPSGLKSLPYGPQKKGEKGDRKTRIVSQPSTTAVATTSEKKPAPTKKRARAASKADKNPPAKRRTLRTRQAKTVDEDHDADDDEDVEDMLVVQTNYSPPQPPSPFHVAEKRLEGRQMTEEFSSEEQHTHGDNLEITYPEQHSSEEYYSQRAMSHESASEERHLEQDSQGYNSQDDDLSRDAASVPEPSQAQPTETPASYVHKPYFLTPKPRQKPKTASISYSKSVDPKPTSTEPSAEAVKEREDLYQRMFGAKIPSQWQDALKQTIGHSSPKPVESREEEQDDGDSDKSFSFLDEPKLTSAEWASWREQQKRFRGHVELPQTPTGRLETKRKPAAKASESRPNAARALVKWAERDDTCRVPNAEQMEALLDGFNTEEAAKVTPRSRSQPSSTRSQPSSRAARRHHPYSKTVASPRTAQRRPHRDEPIASDQEGKDAIDNASADNQSEVPTETQTPQTPTQPPQESRGFWNGVSAVASIFTSPLQFFDRRRNQQDSPMATTNGTAVMGLSATTQSADDPFTPMKLRPRPKTSQSERKRQPQSVRNRGPQTERRRNSRDQPKPPIHLRGIVSPSRIAEIHRQQDRLAAARNKKRAAYEEEADAEEDSDAERSSMAGSKTGEKRKRTKGAVRTPPAGPPGTFRVPSPGSSDDSSDEEEQTIIQQSPGRVRYTPIPVTPRKDLIDDYSANSSPFTSISGRPATSTVWNAPPDFEPTYKEYSRTSPKSKISPKSKASAKMKPSTSPSPTKKSRATAKLVQDTPLQSIDFGESDSSFKVPDTGNSSDSDEEEIATPKTGDAAQTKSLEPDPSVLQSKQWTQTPPPKPRPSNAQLPQFPPPLSAAEAAKAKAEKFKPKQPSSLRNVTQMSPLQIEKENLIVRDHITSHTSFAMLLEESGISKVEWERANAMQDNFFRNADPDVIAAVNALPDSQIAEYPLPPSLSETLLGLGQSEVEKEVEKYFR